MTIEIIETTKRLADFVARSSTILAESKERWKSLPQSESEALEAKLRASIAAERSRIEGQIESCRVGCSEGL